MKPSFSIITPTYNRPQQLRGYLESLMQLNYPRDRFEVVLIDDGSSTPLKPITDEFRDSLQVIYLRQENQGPAAARNSGIEQANGECLAFTDDDCRPDPNWLSMLARQLQQTPDRLVGGRTINQLTENIYAEASQMIIEVVYNHYNADPQNARFFANNNFAVSTSLFSEIGGFNSHFRTSEDREFCDRWFFSGKKMTYVPEAIIYHAHELNFTRFCKQHFRYGCGAHKFHQIRAERGSGKMTDEFTFHLNWTNWLLAPFRRASGWKAVRLSGALVVWQVVNAVGFLWEKWRPKT